MGHWSIRTPDQIIEIERSLVTERYVNLCIGNAIGLGVSLKLDNERIARVLPKLVASHIETAIRAKRPSLLGHNGA